jgi:hypothetical protein
MLDMKTPSIDCTARLRFTDYPFRNKSWDIYDINLQATFNEPLNTRRIISAGWSPCWIQSAPCPFWLVDIR